ncbi:putative Ig domain-containing protein [Aeromicrobium sp. CnD17-E]|uniref:putative Ig domain-containing protein n=1 Tax=Aeromicrobium sp. CnD17-E TaxID=2954487 RepID=UPI0020971ECE|nr:putative Ig domain-containing protein [Aeromicrobium sp. CnD17-E]MCO7238067.1 putative Ig domain-containing protein [Aeromicrobium sp. CnD17-E]
MPSARPSRLTLLVLLVTGILLAGMLPASAASSRTLSLKASSTTPTAGSTVTLSGTLSASPKGATVTVQRLSGSRWVKVTSVRTTGTKGAWSTRLTVRTVGSTKLRAVSAAIRNRKAATSRSTTLDVRRKVTVTAALTPSRVTVGDDVVVSGKATPFVRGTTISVQSVSGRTATTVASTTLAADGTYRVTLRTTKTGSTTYRAVVAGRTGYAAATSPSRTLVVEATPVQPVITTSSLPRGRTGVAYNARLTTDGDQPGTWSVSPALPAGLALDARSGAITGTPTTAGDVSTRVTFTHDNGKVATTTLTLSVDESPRITTASLPTALKGAPYDQTLTASQGGSWTRTSGSLPPGLSLGSDGRLSGTPTSSDASSTFTVRFTSASSGLTADRTYTVRSTRIIATTEVVAGQVGVPYRYQLRTNAPTAGTWGTRGGTPGGLTLSPDGVLSGTPTQAGTSYVVLTFTPTGATAPADEQNLFPETEAAGSTTPSTGEVSGGYGYACRVNGSDRAAACWGSNYGGQLGTGPVSSENTVRRQATAVVGSSAWLTIDSGDFFSTCGIKTNNSLWCWGRNDNGILGSGDGDASWADSPRAVVGGGSWSDVGIGAAHACGIKTDASLWCWGPADQLGETVPSGKDSVSSPLRVGQALWRSVSVADFRTCAVRLDDTLWCWGKGERPTQVVGSWQGVVTSAFTTCGVRTDGTLWCWGRNTSGQLGVGTTTDSAAPVQVGRDTGWSQVSVSSDLGTGSTCATRTDGTAWCWGSNTSGQLGDGTTTASSVPVRVDQTRSWSSVTTGKGYACGVKNDGSQRCWGTNSGGELGNGRNDGGGAMPTKVVG